MAEEVTHDEITRSLARSYVIRSVNRSYSVTLPPAVAKMFLAVHGEDVIFELSEEGLVMKPAPPATEVEVPSWLKPARNGKEKSKRR